MLDQRGVPEGVRAQLRLIATTDLHVHLLPYDYYADRPTAAMGLAQAAPLIRALRRGPAESLLLDNGDFLQGNLLSDWLATEGGRDGRAHPMIAAMNALGYDAGTLGNHEFNYGLAYLREALAQARFPVVSANVRAEGPVPLVAPWTIVARELAGSDGGRHPIRVGVIGFAPPQIAQWERQSLGGEVGTRDILAAAAAEVPRLRAAGADLVVALCHSGLGREQAEPMMENAAVPLAATEGIDAVVAGHTHESFPGRGAASAAVDPATGTVHGRPVVQPGFFGSHVGVIDLRLRLDGGGRWHVARHDVRLERVACRRRADGAVAAAPVDSVVAAIAAPSHQRLVEAARRPVGRTEVALQSYFSLVAPDATLDVVADAQRLFARRLLEGTPEARLPLLSAVTPFKTGGRSGPAHYIDVPTGPLALRQAAELYIHPNTFCVVEVTGADLLDWLERSASLFCRLIPGETDQPLLDPGFPSYCFDVLEGLSYAIDPTAPARTNADGLLLDAEASRVGDLRHEGRPVRPEDRFAVATNSYRTGAGGGFAAAARARVIAQSPRATRDIVLDHVRRGPLAPRPRASWRFAPLPGTAAWFDTGPGALGHPEGPQGRRVRPLGPAPDGFWRYSLAF